LFISPTFFHQGTEVEDEFFISKLRVLRFGGTLDERVTLLWCYDAAFDNLQQFKTYRQAIAAFHTGIRPNEYYKAKNRKTGAEDKQTDLRTDRTVVNRVLDKIEVLLISAQIDFSVDNYQQEITKLLDQCNSLRHEEEALRDEMIQLDNRKSSILRQINIAESAASELGKDFVFASEKLEDDVECPTCGAHYDNSFAERFGIAADEDRVRLLLVELNDEHQQCLSDMQTKQKLVGDVAERLIKINSLLEVRQGEVKLRDVLQSEGKKEVRTVLRKEVDELNRKIGELDAEISAIAFGSSSAAPTDSKRDTFWRWADHSRLARTVRGR
jgi:DNA repair exonuclease SbcCD ATPase subunit